MSLDLRGATGGLLALNGLLLAALAALWLAPGPAAQWRHWSAPAPQPPALDGVEGALLVANPAAAAAYPAVLARPLLDPARRPQAAANPGAAASAPVAAIDQVRLLGIVAGPALTGVLIEQQGSSQFLRRGARVGDWVLDSVRDRQALFVRNGEQRRIELPVAQADAASQAGGAATAPGAAQPARPVRPRAVAPAVPAAGARGEPPVALDKPAAPSGPATGAASPAEPASAAPARAPSIGAFGGSVASPRPSGAPR